MDCERAGPMRHRNDRSLLGAAYRLVLILLGVWRMAGGTSEDSISATARGRAHAPVGETFARVLAWEAVAAGNVAIC